MNVSFYRWLAWAALLLAFAVALGAFGAHGLKGKLDAYSQGVYEKAVFYHFVHAIGLFLAALLGVWGLAGPTAGHVVCSLLTGGVLLFSGSLYLLAILRVSWLGAITPLGGLAFIGAWLVLAMVMWRK